MSDTGPRALALAARGPKPDPDALRTLFELSGKYFVAFANIIATNLSTDEQAAIEWAQIFSILTEEMSADEMLANLLNHQDGTYHSDLVSDGEDALTAFLCGLTEHGSPLVEGFSFEAKPMERFHEIAHCEYVHAYNMACLLQHLGNLPIMDWGELAPVVTLLGTPTPGELQEALGTAHFEQQIACWRSLIQATAKLTFLSV